ncbi:BLOC-1-related complex subunit 5-like isoform X2 [Paramacrobiotus metropolitanus]|uniref:BLOC-1-related complex subunit 5-like isoform X2 n=1 Tax=Paramacrobiotus metropolitanus TaxID=2943436 RepID=UPI002445FC5F|nr:BLOC-1-related complex subunit 5-like isoform X2 [Paramacrobiotus metropolitanus]
MVDYFHFDLSIIVCSLIMGADQSSQGQQRDAPPTPSTVKSFPEEIAASARNPPIDAFHNNEQARVGRLTRFLSDAMPSRPISKLPIPQEIHVVKEGSIEAPTIEQDDDLKHLLSLPTFLPVVKGSVSIPSVRDSEITDRLDYRKMLMIGLRYQQYLRQCSDIVSVEQQAVMGRVKEADQTLLRETASLSEKQKLLARYSETFGTVTDISKTLDKISVNLDKTVAVMENLNQQLPMEYRMPPFKVHEK